MTNFAERNAGKGPEIFYTENLILKFSSYLNCFGKIDYSVNSERRRTGLTRGQKLKILYLFLIFCVPEVTKLTLTLFFEGFDLSDFFVLLHKCYCGLAQPTGEE